MMPEPARNRLKDNINEGSTPILMSVPTWYTIVFLRVMAHENRNPNKHREREQHMLPKI